MYCCARGTYHCQHATGIRFQELKTKYNIDEDIVVEYAVQDNIHASTRDWIGIFPRGWTNLQQYLTFEYAVVAPKMTSSSFQSMMFLHTFHQEASANIDYHFVYVSKEIEILGTSSYFRFTVSPTPHSCSVPQNSRRPEYVVATGGYPPTIVPVAHNDTSKSPIVAANGASGTINGIAQPHHANRLFADHRQRMCRFCCATKLAPTIAANRVQFLLSHNEKLVARMGRLERDLQLAETAVKHGKMAQASLTRRLQAYEAFVTEMFKCLNFKGIVKITDKVGKEIIIRRVKPKELSSVHNERPDKSISIPKLSILNQSTEMKTCNPENNVEIKKFHETARNSNSLLLETIKNQEIKSRNLERKTLFMEMGSASNQETNNSKISLSVADNLSEHDTKISGAALSAAEITADSKSGRRPYVTQEAIDEVGAERNTSEQTSKNGESNFTQDGSKEIQNNIDTDKQTTKTINSPKSAFNSLQNHCDDNQDLLKQVASSIENGNLKEWALECECDLEISNRMYQEINTGLESSKCFTGIRVTDETATASVADAILSNTEKLSENVSNDEVPQSKPSAILIKGRNAKFAIIRY